MKSNSVNSRNSNATTAYFQSGSHAGSNPASAQQQQASHASSSLTQNLPPRSATSAASTQRASRQSIDSAGRRSNYGGALASVGSRVGVSSLADMGGAAASRMGSVGAGPSRFARSTTYTPSVPSRTLTLQEQFYYQDATSVAASARAPTNTAS